jgi:hypothetical protein
MRIATAAAAAAIIVSTATGALAQGTGITLMPPDQARWDITVHAGRHGVNRSDIGDEWNRWYESAAVSASGGFYVTPHVKVEGDVSHAGEASLYTQQSVVVPGQSWPYPRFRDHRLRAITGSGAVMWQFFENQWFHPFAGAGVLVLHERERAEALAPQAVPVGPAGTLPFIMPALPALDTSRTAVQPFLTTGFKVYVSKQAFLRTDVRVGVSRDGVASAQWRGGIGIDF